MSQMERFLEQVYAECEPAFRYEAGSVSEWREWRGRLEPQFIRALGGFPESRPALEPVLLERTELQGYVRERVEITTYEGVRMPVYVLIPDRAEGPSPVAIACHGHGYGSRAVVGLGADGSELEAADAEIHKQFAVSLVKRGFLVVAPELAGFGDRRLEEDAAKGERENSCFRLAAALLMAGRTMAAHRIYETMRAIDYAAARPDAAADRIGCMGLSGGGLVAAFTAALDRRIRATVVSGYTNTFKDSILAMRHCIDNYIPGILNVAEMPELLGLIAPRPLFVEAGRDDRIFPLHGTMEAVNKLELIYETAGAKTAFEYVVFEGGHEVSGLKSYDWLRERV